MGATIGSRLGLRIGAEEIEVVVTSIREVDWQSLKPNFFVILPPAVLAPFPKTYFTSFFLPEAEKGRLNDLVKTFPTMTVIELDIVVTEIRQIINRVGQAIEVVLGVILLAGALVLIAGVRASIDARVSESALLRAMGARKQLILGAIALEFSVLGALAGTMAVAGAELAAWGLQTHVLDLSYQPTFWLWPLGVADCIARLVELPACGVNTPFGRIARAVGGVGVALPIYPKRWATASRSSDNSAAVASILLRLKSLTSTSRTIAQSPALQVQGKE